MDLKLWCTFATILLVSVGAVRYDQGPQKFYESSSSAPRKDQNYETKEVVLYLTPSQIKALEANGAVVRQAEAENESDEAAESPQANEDQPEEIVEQEQEQDKEQEQEEDQEQGQEQEENESQADELEQQADQGDQPEQENRDQEQSEDLDLEEIFRILNEEQIEEEEAQAEQPRNEPQVEEENVEESRTIPPRFQGRQKQQQKQGQQLQRYIAPEDKKARSKTYAYIRYQRNGQLQKARVQPLRAQQQKSNVNEEQQQEAEREVLRRFKLIPYEVEEKPDETPEQQGQSEQEQQEPQQQTEEGTNEQEENAEKLNALTSPLSPEKFTKVIGQRKNKLLQNEQELQAILKELKKSPKYNDQKYAIEIEKLKANLEKQNTLAKAEVIAKVAPQVIAKQIQKQRPNKSAKLIKPQPSTTSAPTQQAQRLPRPQPVPVEVEKREPLPVTKNVYVKVNKPYLVQRIVPVQIRKEVPVGVPIHKPQKLTILRHVWEH